jgi:hypothetical protein
MRGELLTLQLKSEQIKTLTLNGGIGGYFDATENQQKVAMEYVNKLVQVEQDKPVLIVSIPTANKLHRLGEGFDLGRMYWWNYLKEIASNNANVGFFDLSSPKLMILAGFFTLVMSIGVLMETNG